MQRKIVFFMVPVLALALGLVLFTQQAVASDEVANLTHGSGDRLDIGTALTRVVEGNPGLAALGHNIDAARAHADQAGLIPNPELKTELENFAGSGEFSGTDEAETTVMLSQALELGGKRMRRRRAADLTGDLAIGEYERARIATLERAAVAFVDVAAEQELLALSDDAIALADRMRSIVAKRVESGSSSRVELTRSDMASHEARLQRERRARRLDTARRNLATQWGSKTIDFDRVDGAFGSLNRLPSFAELQARLARSPELASSAIEVQRREALHDLERSRRLPNVTVGAGYRRFSGPEDGALVAELSVPLPLFDRNQGAVRESQYNVLRAVEEKRSVELEIDNRLSTAYEALAIAHAEGRAYDDTLVSRATEAFESLRAGYREGRFSYLDVLDAQRILIETRFRRVQAFADYHRAVAKIEGLVGAEVTAGMTVAEGSK